MDISNYEAIKAFLQEVEKLVAEVEAPTKELERIYTEFERIETEADVLLKKAKVLKLTIKDNKAIELCVTALFKLRQISKSDKYKA